MQPIKLNKDRVVRYALGIIVGFGLISFILNLQLLKLGEFLQFSYAAFALIHFIGFLFFVFFPVDFLPFLYMFGGFNPKLVFLIAVLTAFLAHFVNYLCGLLFSGKVIKIIGKEKYEKAKKTIDKYGGYAVFIFNALPLPSSILVLSAGIMRYDFRKAMFLSFIGLLLKYGIIVFAYTMVK